MAEQDESGFLTRWSRRKQEQREAALHEEESAEQIHDSALSESSGSENAELAPEGATHQVELPDPESLSADADFSSYLKQGVPDHLRQRALRRIWRTNPLYSIIDGLDDYCEDFNDPTMLAKPVKTLFQLGRGMILPEATEEAKAEELAAETPHPSDDAASGEKTADDSTSNSDGPKRPEEEHQSNNETNAEPETGDRPLRSEIPNPADEPRAVSADLEATPVGAAARRRAAGRRALARRWGSTSDENDST